MATTSRPLILAVSHLLIAALAAWGALHWSTTDTQQTPANTATDETTNRIEPPLFRVGERTYGFFDLPIEYRQPLHEVRKLTYQQQMLVVEDAVVEAYIQQQMSETQQDRMQVQNQLMPNAEPTEAEIVAFYEENQSASAPPLERIRGELETYLTAAKQESMKKELLTRLLVSGDAEMLLEAPRLERPNTMP